MQPRDQIRPASRKGRGAGADYIATGHYARLDRGGAHPALWEAADKKKDQSYFLWALEPGQVRQSLFPLGSNTKSQVREIARKLHLPTAEKKDSQGLCFVGRLQFGYFLREHLSQREGAVVNSGGKVVGKHDGVTFYTIGQRHGLGIGGKVPYYVAEKNITNDTLVVGEGRDGPILFKKEIWVHRLNWLTDFRAGQSAVFYDQERLLGGGVIL